MTQAVAAPHTTGQGQAARPPRCRSLPADRRAFLERQFAAAVAEQPGLAELRDRLLALGGHAVCFPGLEEDLGKILKRGEALRPRRVKYMPGEPSQCHSNSARLWDVNRESCEICTGYGLSADGLWRPHTWVLWHRRDGRTVIAETTERRLVYYGAALTRKEAEAFLWANWL